MPSARPTACPVFAIKSVQAISTTSPTRIVGGFTPGTLSGAFIIELLQEPIRFVDQPLDSLRRGIGGRATQGRAYDGEHQRRGGERNAQDQKCAQQSAALLGRF